MLTTGLGVTARIAAAFVCGVLFCLAYFTLWDSLTNTLYALVLLAAGVALWAVTLAATRPVKVPGVLQLLVMIVGAAAGWLALLAATWQGD